MDLSYRICQNQWRIPNPFWKHLNTNFKVNWLHKQLSPPYWIQHIVFVENRLWIRDLLLRISPTSDFCMLHKQFLTAIWGKFYSFLQKCIQVTPFSLKRRLKRQQRTIHLPVIVEKTSLFLIIIKIFEIFLISILWD